MSERNKVCSIGIHRDLRSLVIIARITQAPARRVARTSSFEVVTLNRFEAGPSPARMMMVIIACIDAIGIFGQHHYGAAVAISDDAINRERD